MAQAKFKLDKLLRHKLPEYIRSHGVIIAEENLSEAEYIDYLKKKVSEEASEILASKTQHDTLEELGDLLEAIYQLCTTLNISKQELEEARSKKLQEKGDFTIRKRYTYVSIPENKEILQKWISYYRSQPEKYPEIVD